MPRKTRGQAEGKAFERTSVSALPERPHEGDDGEADERSCDQSVAQSQRAIDARHETTANQLGIGADSLAVGTQRSPSMRAKVIQ